MEPSPLDDGSVAGRLAWDAVDVRARRHIFRVGLLECRLLVLTPKEGDHDETPALGDRRHQVQEGTGENHAAAGEGRVECLPIGRLLLRLDPLDLFRGQWGSRAAPVVRGSGQSGVVADSGISSRVALATSSERS